MLGMGIWSTIRNHGIGSGHRGRDSSLAQAHGGGWPNPRAKMDHLMQSVGYRCWTITRRKFANAANRRRTVCSKLRLKTIQRWNNSFCSLRGSGCCWHTVTRSTSPQTTEVWINRPEVVRLEVSECLLWVKSGHWCTSIHVRFTPESGHRWEWLACPLCAKSAHCCGPLATRGINLSVVPFPPAFGQGRVLVVLNYKFWTKHA